MSTSSYPIKRPKRWAFYNRILHECFVIPWSETYKWARDNISSRYCTFQAWMRTHVRSHCRVLSMVGVPMLRRRCVLLSMQWISDWSIRRLFLYPYNYYFIDKTHNQGFMYLGTLWLSINQPWLPFELLSPTPCICILTRYMGVEWLVLHVLRLLAIMCMPWNLCCKGGCKTYFLIFDFIYLFYSLL